jgi:putative MFS transporter
VGGRRFTPYQRKLFVFLSVAAFFEGYDFTAFAQVLNNLRDDMGLSESTTGIMYGIISAGTVVAFLMVRLADRIGRRKVLTITIAGYTAFTCLTAFAPDPITFTAAQFFARIFLIGEWGVAMVYAAEEFPAAQRGTVIGVVQACTALGSVVCAGVVPLLLKTPWEWRTVYIIAVIPLVLIMYARRGLKETRRFEEQVKGKGKADRRRKLIHILKTPYRIWVVKLGLIWGVMYVCANVAVVHWKDFAIRERSLTDGQAGGAIAIAAVAAMPLVFYAGRLLDRVGRRHGAAIIFSLGAAGVLGSYTFQGRWPLTAALVFGIFGAAAMPGVLNTITTELFPTELRADAFAWCNNLLGRIGYVLGPIFVGQAAQVMGAKGPVVAITAVAPLIAIILIYAMVPETKGRELEETSALEVS